MTLTLSNELALTESATLRSQYVDQVEVLDYVDPLETVVGTEYVTTEMVAAYFGVGIEAIKSAVKENRAELAANGYRVLRSAELRSFKDLTGMESTTPNLALYSARTVLNLAMLLRDSDKARAVRSYLLDLAATPEETSADLALPKNYEEALAELLEQVRTNNALQAANQAKDELIGKLEPKAELANLHAQGETYVNLRSFARKIQQWYKSRGRKTYQATIFDFLHQIGLIIRRPGGLEHNQATAWAIQQGYAVNYTHSIIRSDMGVENVTAARLTPRGEAYAWDRIYNVVGEAMAKEYEKK
ncbi:hypothetical protein GCM10010149_89050 [Nonomuraea roseoviolacea subsp. roseoviolacea]|uniref:phage antirepressor KilAC domain-containing protein n=1 Tax=Nonomuraea roseoviolacea TaxID=103837 RepID=UPI0031D2970A